MAAQRGNPPELELLCSYATKYDRRSRRRNAGVGVQGLQRALQELVAPGLHEWDMRSAQFTILAQLVARVGVSLEHTVAGFEQLKRYPNERQTLHAAICSNPVTAKKVVLKVLNGMRLSAEQENNEFLKALHIEGRLLRWVACTLEPAFHTHMLNVIKKSWPEATTLFYVWSACEDWALQSILDVARRFSPRHLSLHYDAVKIDSECYGPDPSVFKAAAEQQIQVDTGYQVVLELKANGFLLDLLKAAAGNAKVSWPDRYGEGQAIVSLHDSRTRE